MTMGTWALLGSAPSRSCEHRQVGKASDVSVQAGAGGQQAGSRNIRSGKSLLSANCRPNAQEIPQWANAETETSWLKVPTAPFTRFKIKAQEMTFHFSVFLLGDTVIPDSEYNQQESCHRRTVLHCGEPSFPDLR